ELKMLEESGLDIKETNIDCTTFSNDIQKRGCSFVYTATSACCSEDCNWLLEFHCMNPSQMICKK
ncbi:hypothetical protein, partial [Salmonella sp. s51933]|uniref:hypothetical protein n=1 Tax=Salmonella sp. s51933 TaxID=3160127 RepID=UPI0037541430